MDLFTALFSREKIRKNFSTPPQTIRGTGVSPVTTDPAGPARAAQNLSLVTRHFSLRQITICAGTNARQKTHFPFTPDAPARTNQTSSLSV